MVYGWNDCGNIKDVIYAYCMILTRARKKWGQTPIFLSIFTGNLVGNSDSGKMGSDPDITNRDKNCVNKSEVRPRYY